MTTDNKTMAPSHVATVRSLLEKSKGQIKDALPKHMSPDRMVRVFMTTYNKTPDLQKCEPMTLLEKVMDCSQLGLEPDNTLGLAYLLPFRNNKKGCYDVQLIIGYKGLIDLAMRSGKINDIYAVPVYENEPFNIEQGVNRKLHHEPLPPSKRGKNIVGVYAVAILKDGPPKWEWMWSEEIEDIRKRSPAGKFGPWESDRVEMMKKTVVRRLSKTLPLSPEFVKAASVDEGEEFGPIRQHDNTQAAALVDMIQEAEVKETERNNGEESA